MDSPAEPRDRFLFFCGEARRRLSEKRLPEAISWYEKALSENPDSEKVHHNLGAVYRRIGKLDRAEKCFRTALSLKPDSPETLNNLGALRLDRGEYGDAETLFRKALSLAPDSMDAHYNLGLVRQKSGDLDAAIAQFEKTIALNPESAEGYHNLGAVKIKRGELEAAADCFRKALTLKPGYHKVRVDQALLSLLKGDLKTGFEQYEYRYRLSGDRMNRQLAPVWDGSPIPGKTLLVAFEQGLGDTIQFVRYLPEARKRCGKLVFYCQKSLHPLLEGRSEIDRLSDSRKNLAFDHGVSLLSLPRLLGTAHVDRIPGKAPYLFPDAEKVRRIGTEIPTDRWNIGLVWAGNPRHQNDWNRSLHLSDFAVLRDLPGVCFHGLQVGFRSEEALSPPDGMDFRNWSDRISDFSDTASILHRLDLVISVDTSVAHLAGAMAKPLWLILPHIPDWRWLLRGETSPWYPSARLYRQKRIAEWGPVFARIQRDLSQILRNGRPPRDALSKTFFSVGSTDAARRDADEPVRKPSPEGWPPRIEPANEACFTDPSPESGPGNNLEERGKSARQWLGSGLALRKQGRFAEAEEAFRKGLDIDPGSPELLFAMGVAILEKGSPNSAIPYLERALGSSPNHVETLIALGNARHRIGNSREARRSFETALRNSPDHAEACKGMAICLREENRWEEALEFLIKARKLRPDDPEILLSLGNLHKARGYLAAAESAYRQALEMQPDSPRAHLFLGLFLLLDGRFREGWAEYEWRWQLEPLKSRMESLPGSLWDGDPLGNRTLLVHSEQGFGDSIQFVRFVRQIDPEQGRIVLRCDKELTRLFSELPEIHRVVTKDAPVPEADVHASLIQLARILETDEGDIPSRVPYLEAEHEAVRKWARIIGETSGPSEIRVGLVWSGNPAHKKDRERSIPLYRFAPLLNTPGVSFHGLQVGEASGEIRAAGFEGILANHSARLTDFEETAAAIRNLDLIVSADTAVAHLAGALGKPVWTLLPFAPDWRWQREREETPWYPGMRLFRQPTPGQWVPVLDRVCGELQDEVARFDKLRDPAIRSAPAGSVRSDKPHAADFSLGKSAEGEDAYFFVTGFPRSGTTWLQMLLDAHPQVRCRPEDFFSVFLKQIPALFDRYNRRLRTFHQRTQGRQPLCLLDDGDEQAVFRFLVRRILRKALAKDEILRSGANDNEIIGRFSVYRSQFPRSRFIAIVRDPRDVTVSSWFINRKIDQRFAERYPDMSKWARHIRDGWRQFAENLRNAREIAGAKMTILRYEDLRMETGRCAGHLFDFLGVRSDPDAIDPCVEKTRFSRLAEGREAGEEDPGDFFRKGIVGDWKNHLDEATNRAFIEGIGEEMQAFGYE